MDPETDLPDYFPDVFPHRKQETHRWLHDYLRIVVRITKEREELTKETGSVDRDSVWDAIAERRRGRRPEVE